MDPFPAEGVVMDPGVSHQDFSSRPSQQHFRGNNGAISKPDYFVKYSNANFETKSLWKICRQVSTTPLMHSSAFMGGCRGDYVWGHKIKSNPRGNWANLVLGPNSSNSSKWLERRDIKMGSHINQSPIGEWNKSVNPRLKAPSAKKSKLPNGPKEPLWEGMQQGINAIERVPLQFWVVEAMHPRHYNAQDNITQAPIKISQSGSAEPEKSFPKGT